MRPSVTGALVMTLVTPRSIPLMSWLGSRLLPPRDVQCGMGSKSSLCFFKVGKRTGVRVSSPRPGLFFLTYPPTHTFAFSFLAVNLLFSTPVPFRGHSSSYPPPESCFFVSRRICLFLELLLKCSPTQLSNFRCPELVK